MTKQKTHAERELEILLKTTPDAIIRHFIPEIIAICEAFGRSGQSGASAPYTASALSQAIKKLCLFEPIAPLTGEDDEWMDVSGVTMTSALLQNKREGGVFKDMNKEDSGAYYLDAIVWKTPNGHTWTGTAELPDGTEIRSRQYIKSFPFTPKTFVIHVNEEEVTPGNWRFEVFDQEELAEVFEYYDVKYQG